MQALSALAFYITLEVTTLLGRRAGSRIAQLTSSPLLNRGDAVLTSIAPAYRGDGIVLQSNVRTSAWRRLHNQRFIILPGLFENPGRSRPGYFGGVLLGRTQMKAHTAAAAALVAHTASAA